MTPRRLLLLVLVVALAALVPPAAAHTQIQRATPGPGESVGGVVDVVELDFLDPVVPTPTIAVSGPDGAPVPGLGQAALVADDVARVGFDPLTVAGVYRVDYTFVAIDGDEQTAAHTFSFEPAPDAAAEPDDAEPDDAPDPETAGGADPAADAARDPEASEDVDVGLIAAAVVAAALVLVVAGAASRRRRSAG